MKSVVLAFWLGIVVLAFYLGILVGGASSELLNTERDAANEQLSFWRGVDIGQTLVACQYVADVHIYDVSLVEAAEWARAGAYPEFFDGFSPEKCREIAQRYQAHVEASAK